MDQLLEEELQIKEIEKKILESSKRSLALLHESEEIGVAIAQELDEQTQSLEKTNVNLDIIKNDLKCSHKHLKGMNSLLYAWKSYFSNKFHNTPDMRQACSNKLSGSSSRINEKIKTTKIRSQITNEDRYKSYSAAYLQNLNKQQIAPTKSNQDVNKQLDADLDEMDKYITRLKCIGIAHYEAIEYSNNLIDSIQSKVDGADSKICKLNKRIEKHL